MKPLQIMDIGGFAKVRTRSTEHPYAGMLGQYVTDVRLTSSGLRYARRTRPSSILCDTQ